MRIFFAITLLLGLFIIQSPVSAQGQSGPATFEQFSTANIRVGGDGHFAIYNSGNNYFIEIPKDDLGKDILISTQVVGGFSSYVSPASGTVQFRLGRNNSLDMFKNRSTTFAADTVDYCMIQAIQNSGLVAADRSFPIAAFGKDKQSFIIDISADLQAPVGLFDVSANGSLGSPDLSRSGVKGLRMIEGGVVFTAIRSQTQFVATTGGSGGASAPISFLIEMLIQRVPDHGLELKKDNPAYGFNTVEHTNYDTRNYRANKENFIQRWSLEASAENKKLQAKGVAVDPIAPISVWIDTITPAAFQTSIREALKQWEGAFEKAGWKNVFRFVNDGSLSYKKLVLYWGNAYAMNTKTLITDPVSGEIMAARVNLMDESAKELALNYFLWCGLSDPRVKEECQPVELRQQILTSQISGLLGEVLGLKANLPALTAFSPEQLRDAAWLQKWGPTASVVGATVADYLVQPEDKITPEFLLPKVSVYDNEAVAFAYGSRTEFPSIKATFYAEKDAVDPFAQPTMLSNDILKASELGIQNLSNIYPKIPDYVEQWPAYKTESEQIVNLGKQGFSLYQFYVNQVAMVVGGRSKRTVIRGANEEPVVYVSKEKQEAALDALERYAFSGVPAWFKNERINSVLPINVETSSITLATGVIQNLLRKEVLWSLADAQTELGNEAFTCSDLFRYFNRVIFHDFDSKYEYNVPQMNIQLQFVTSLLAAVNENNITGGLNDVSGNLQLYLIDLRNQFEAMLESKKLDEKMRGNCELILMKMNREYFNKTV